MEIFSLAQVDRLKIGDTLVLQNIFTSKTSQHKTHNLKAANHRFFN